MKENSRELDPQTMQLLADMSAKHDAAQKAFWRNLIALHSGDSPAPVPIEVSKRRIPQALGAAVTEVPSFES